MTGQPCSPTGKASYEFMLPRGAKAMDDNSLLWTLFALIVVNTVVVILAYVSSIRESKKQL
jgi:hypothetical protein